MNITNQKRTASLQRSTRETDISVSVNLDGSGTAQVSSGLGFLDHMLTALACHSSIDITLQCKGDLHVDDHHSVEDCAIVLGRAIDAALGDRNDLARFGYCYAPLDESLARCVIDLATRVHATVNLQLTREKIGDVACENLTHWFVTLASSLRCTLHIDIIRGENDHHKAEAAFKAFALALKAAVSRTQPGRDISTKGSL